MSWELPTIGVDPYEQQRKFEEAMRKSALDDVRLYTAAGGVFGALVGYTLGSKMYADLPPLEPPAAAAATASNAAELLAEPGSLAYEARYASRPFSLGRFGTIPRPVALALLCGTLGMFILPISFARHQLQAVWSEYPPPPIERHWYTPWREALLGPGPVRAPAPPRPIPVINLPLDEEEKE